MDWEVNTFPLDLFPCWVTLPVTNPTFYVISVDSN